MTQGSRLGALCILVGFAGCTGSGKPADYVARVGDAYLLHEDVSVAMSTVPPGLDSAHALEQIIDRWVTEELLSQEAERRQLQHDSDVRRRIASSERQVLISSLVDLLYDDVPPPTDLEIATYFERNKEKLSLREPFLRVRYLASRDSLLAVGTVRILNSLNDSTSADSLWLATIERVAEDRDVATALSTSYFPESRIFRNLPSLFKSVAPLKSGEVTLIATSDASYHVLQLVDRVPAGTTPQLEWIIDEIRNQLLIQKRKQMYIDQVQRLRNNALAQRRLELR